MSFALLHLGCSLGLATRSGPIALDKRSQSRKQNSNMFSRAISSEHLLIYRNGMPQKKLWQQIF